MTIGIASRHSECMELVSLRHKQTIMNKKNRLTTNTCGCLVEFFVMKWDESLVTPVGTKYEKPRMENLSLLVASPSKYVKPFSYVTSTPSQQRATRASNLFSSAAVGPWSSPVQPRTSSTSDHCGRWCVEICFSLKGTSLRATPFPQVHVNRW